jgi:putative membrane protein
MMDGSEGWHHGGGSAWFGWFVPMVVLAVLAVGVAVLVLRLMRTHPGLPPAAPAVDPALTELRLRYARGEVSREDFLAISADLGGGGPPESGPPG